MQVLVKQHVRAFSLAFIENHAKEALESHLQIRDAILRRDTETAKKKMELHVGNYLTDMMQKQMRTYDIYVNKYI